MVCPLAPVLHDCVSLEKIAANRADGSRLAADKAAVVLTVLGWGKTEIATVAHAVVAHSFSFNVTPETIEAKTLQDADRLDAIGLIGVARCFYVARRMGSGLNDPADPIGDNRILDDRAFALDHFETKLLKLASGFQTKLGLRWLRHVMGRFLRFGTAFSLK